MKKTTYLKQKTEKKIVIRHYMFEILIFLLFTIVLYDSFSHKTPFYYICFLLFGSLLGWFFSIVERVKHNSENGIFIIDSTPIAFIMTIFLILIRYVWGRSILEFANVVWTTDALYLIFIGIYWSRLKNTVRQIDETIYEWISKEETSSHPE
jgi:hypothetical protein